MITCRLLFFYRLALPANTTPAQAADLLTQQGSK